MHWPTTGATTASYFVQGDALTTLHALADQLEGRMQVDPQLVKDVEGRTHAAAGLVDATLGAYVALKNELAAQVGKPLWWVRDITLSNSMWGNRAPMLDNPRAGVHALGGGIGQGLAMAIGVAVADAEHALGRKTVALVGDGGFMLNVGELACAVQEKANLVVLLMNDSRYGVIRNIQDDIYGGRHCYVDLHTPNFGQFCSSLQVTALSVERPQRNPPRAGTGLCRQRPGGGGSGHERLGPFLCQVCRPHPQKRLTRLLHGTRSSTRHAHRLWRHRPLHRATHAWLCRRKHQSHCGVCWAHCGGEKPGG